MSNSTGISSPFWEKVSRLWILVLLFQYFFIGKTVGQIVINEFVADNYAGLTDPQFNSNGDWIELYNTSNSAINLSGMYFSDDPSTYMKWAFPQGTNIGGRSYLIIWADNKNTGLHTNFRLNRSGEFLVLSTSMGIVIDSITFPEQFQDISYGRIPNGSGQWSFMNSPTPGAENSSQSGGQISSPPLFSKTRGFYSGPLSLTITPTVPEGIVRYTTDGSDPTESSTRTIGVINISSTTVVKASQFIPGQLPSPVATHTFLINEKTTLPVFSISTDPQNLWNEQTGIYVEGVDYVWGWGNGNFWQDWEKEAFVEMFETDHQVKINQSAALKITGALTRTASQKSLRLTAKGIYGEPKFDYRFFKDKPINSFNDFILRNSGNDWAYSMMADGMMQTIVAGQMDIDYQAYRPAIVFLNGVYWGIHNLREKIGDDYIEENHGFDKNNLDMISQMFDIREGDAEQYNILLDFVNNHDMTDAGNYAFASSMIDVQEYMNYYTVQIFYANHDWPAGNIKFWRPRIDNGVWRWILYDTDIAFHQHWLNTLEWATMEVPPEYPGSTDLFKGFMKNPEFRTRFLSTFLSHLNTTFKSERILSVIDSLQALIQPEIERHINRWKGFHGWTYADATGYYETGWLESYNQWLLNVEQFRRFAKLRKNFILGFFREFYELDKPIDLDVKIEPAGGGRIVIDNSLTVSHNQEATYFKGQEIDLKAIPAPGYAFDGFELKENPLSINETATLIDRNERWKYLDNGIFPGNSWNQLSFNDDGWNEGCGILGYNDEDICTNISYGPDAQNKYITYYFRKNFALYNKDQWSKILIDLVRDDGAIVYLNGQELIRDNMPSVSSFNTLASGSVDYPNETTPVSYELPASLFLTGENVVAVEVHQAQANSSDLLFDLSLKGVVGSEQYQFSSFSDPSISKSFNWKTEIKARFVAGSDPPIIKINEVMPDNLDYLSDRLGSYNDWIELYNPGSEDVDIGGFYMTDDPADPGKWRIPDNNPSVTTISANGYKLFYADDRAFLGPDHLGFKITSVGEMVGLTAKINQNYVWIDSLYFRALNTNTSLGRLPDGTDNWSIFQFNPTPGLKNEPDSPNNNKTDVEITNVYPNPFNDLIYFEITVKRECLIQIWLRDIYGNPIRLLVNETHKPGYLKILWNGTNSLGQKMPSGIYFMTVYAGVFFDTKKILLVE